jgi:TRAP-type mannitol/chloroaromatic compound transport system substrate-binding protein
VKNLKKEEKAMKKTRRDFLKTTGAAAIGAGVVMAGAKPARAQAKTVRWRMATSWPTGIPLFTHMAKVLSDVVHKISGGRFIIDTFPAGAIAPALEITDAVRRGVCQIGHLWPGYDIGVHPASCLLGGYAGSPNSEVKIHWLYQSDGYKLWQDFRREKFEVVAFPGGLRPTEVFAHSHKPIRTLADLKGIKFRTVGAWADILPKLGASVVTLPGGEVLPALERKVIDATEWACPGENLPMGFHEVARFIIIPGVHQPCAPFEYVINPKAWDELPEDLKAIVETAAKVTTLESWTKIGALDMGAMEVFKKRGNVIIELAPEVQAAAYKLGREWADQQVAAAKDPWFKRILDSQRKFEEGWKAVERNRTITYT